MFTLSIVTPEKVHYEGEVKSLTVPGTEGYLGILSNHAPLISALKPGKIEFRDANDTVQILAVSGGFVEVSQNVATILADAVEAADDIDIERARRKYEALRNRIYNAGGDVSSDIDLPSARLELEQAANRIKVYEDTH